MNNIENVEMNEVNQTVKDDAEVKQDANTAPMAMDIQSALSTVIARTEATEIIVEILNAVLNVLQTREVPVFSVEDLRQIQESINRNVNKTNILFQQVEAALAQNNAEPVAAADQVISDAE